jgi:hypothetical protein
LVKTVSLALVKTEAMRFVWKDSLVFKDRQAILTGIDRLVFNDRQTGLSRIDILVINASAGMIGKDIVDLVRTYRQD